MRSKKKSNQIPDAEELWANLQETKQIIKTLNKQYGGISYNNGKMAEEYFYNTFKRDKRFVNQEFDYIKRNVHCLDAEEEEGEEEYVGYSETELDLLLFNGSSAAIIEVKYSAKKDNINVAKLISRVEIVKRVYPEYKNHKFYLGVAAMSFENNLARYLRRKGIATIHQIGKKLVMYDKEVREF